MKTIMRIIKWLVLIILLVFMAFNMYSFINIRILDNKLNTIGRYAVLQVVSPSMEPTIHVGDIVIIDTKANDYQEKNIVTYEDENGLLVTHRIVDIDNYYMVTKGDNNESDDGDISLDAIVGKLVYQSHLLGQIISILQNKIVLVLIFIIGTLICVGFDTKENK